MCFEFMMQGSVMGKKITIDEKPLITVVMCIYSEEEFMINEAIQSVKMQTLKDWELVIVYDNPDNTRLKSYLKNIEQTNIFVYFNERNLGAALSRNVGVERARGKYIAILDGDDVCVADRLERELIYLETRKYDMVCAGSHYIDEKGCVIRPMQSQVTENYLVSCLPYINHVTNSTVFMKKDVYVAMGGYRNYPCSHDYEFWLRVQKAGYKIGYLDRDLVGYRVRSNSITGEKSYLQTIVSAYIRGLYKKNKILENFNQIEFDKYVKKYHIEKPKVIRNYNRSIQQRKKYRKDLEMKKYLVAVISYICAVSGSKIYRLNIYNSIEFKFKKLVGLLKVC